MEIANVSSVFGVARRFYTNESLTGGYQVAYLLAAYFKPPMTAMRGIRTAKANGGEFLFVFQVLKDSHLGHLDE